MLDTPRYRLVHYLGRRDIKHSLDNRILPSYLTASNTAVTRVRAIGPSRKFNLRSSY